MRTMSSAEIKPGAIIESPVGGDGAPRHRHDQVISTFRPARRWHAFLRWHRRHGELQCPSMVEYRRCRIYARRGFNFAGVGRAAAIAMSFVA